MFVFRSLCVCTHVPCPMWEPEDSLSELSPFILWIRLRSLEFAMSPLPAEPLPGQAESFSQEPSLSCSAML